MSRWLLVYVVVVCCVVPGWAQESPQKETSPGPVQKGTDKSEDPEEKPQEKPAAETRKLPGQQENEDPPEVLKPLKPRTVAEDNKLKAGSWLGTGRILEAKNDNKAALEAYKKAVSFDPGSAEIYRGLVGVALKLGLNKEAFEWAEKVSELDPEEGLIRVQLGMLRAQQDDLAGALKWWEEALKSDRFKKDTPNQYVVINKQVGAIYRQLKRNEEAAKCLEIVFNALTDAGDVRINFETKTSLLGRDPAATFEELGESFVDTKRYELAVKAFEKASLRKPNGSASLNFNLARVYLETDKAQQALDELQKYFDAQRQSKGTAAYNLLGDILKKLGKENEFIPKLEAMAEKDSRNSDLQYYLAEKYLKANRLDDAERVYRKTIAFAAEPQGYKGLAAIYQKKGQPAELLEMLAKAYEESKDVDTVETEIKAIAEDEKLMAGIKTAADEARKQDKLSYSAALVAASILSKADKRDEAADLFRYTLSKEKVKDAYFGLVDVLFDQRKYLEAVKVLKDAEDNAENENEKMNYTFTLIRAQEFAGDTVGALETLDGLKLRFPELKKNDQIIYQEAWIYYHAHRYDEAIPKFEDLIAKGSNKTVVRQAQFSLSNIYVLKGDYKKGEEVLEVVYKEAPDDPSVNNDLGYLYADQGKNLEQAEKMIKLALDKEPENSAYLDSMGWVLFKLGKAAEAIPYLEKAVKKGSGSGDETLYDHLGDAYDKTQQPAKAIEAWKTAVQHAKESARPDQKLIDKIEAKLKAREGDQGKLKPATPGSP